MSRLTLNGTAIPVSSDQIVRRERGQGNIRFPCSADHEQDWQPYPVDLQTLLYVMAIHIDLPSSFMHPRPPPSLPAPANMSPGNPSSSLTGGQNNKMPTTCPKRACLAAFPHLGNTNFETAHAYCSAYEGDWRETFLDGNRENRSAVVDWDMEAVADADGNPEEVIGWVH